MCLLEPMLRSPDDSSGSPTVTISWVTGVGLPGGRRGDKKKGYRTKSNSGHIYPDNIATGPKNINDPVSGSSSDRVPYVPSNADTALQFSTSDERNKTSAKD